MPDAADQAFRLEELARDLDLVVFGLEVPPPGDEVGQIRERRRLRTELEELKERVEQIARDLNRG